MPCTVMSFTLGYLDINFRNSRLQHEVGSLGSYKLCRVDCKLMLFGSLTFFLKPSMVIYLCIFIFMSLKGINTYVINLVAEQTDISVKFVDIILTFAQVHVRY